MSEHFQDRVGRLPSHQTVTSPIPQHSQGFPHPRQATHVQTTQDLSLDSGISRGGYLVRTRRGLSWISSETEVPFLFTIQ